MADNEKSETGEPKESEKANEVDTLSEKLETLNMRVRPATKAALKKLAPDGQMTSFVTELIEGAVKQGGGKISIDSSYERLLSETEKYRRELDSIEKALGDKFELVRGVAQKTMALNLQTVDLIVKELLQHQVNHHKDGFSERDKNDFIDWLETWKKNENAEKQLKRVQFEKYGVTIPENLNQEQALAKPKRFISKKDRCRCGGRPEHTLFEHNQRAFHIQDGMHHGINQFCDTPEKQLERINRAGSDHATSKEEKDMIVKYLKEYGSNNQKEMVNIYFYNHGFPPPFPEIEKVEDQKPIILWKPEGRKDD